MDTPLAVAKPASARTDLAVHGSWQYIVIPLSRARSSPGSQAGEAPIKYERPHQGMMRAWSVVALAILMGPTASSAVEATSTQASAYLEAALDLIQQHAMARERVDWPTLREEARAQAAGARTTADTYAALRMVLQRLGDGHSSLQVPVGAGTPLEDTGDGPIHEVLQVDERIARVRLDGYRGSDATDAIAWATRIQAGLAALASTTCGWVVDLRENDGGNLYPMLAALGPLLGEGEHGSFDDARGNRSAWWYREGAAGAGRRERLRVERPVSLDRRPVAILFGPRTGSSGEALAISFVGVTGTRSFGQATGGYSTANAVLPLGDGAALVLTIARMVDRAGKVYGGKVVPDQTSEVPERDAMEWLRSQRVCSS